MANSLTREMILTKTKVDELNLVINLNFWGSEIEDISIVKELVNVETITLSTNKIKSLQCFLFCLELRELFLRNNLIENLSEINYLKVCTKLKILWLGENPCCKLEDYRLKVIGTLPNLNKLDNVIITETEREQSQKFLKIRKKKNSFEINEKLLEKKARLSTPRLNGRDNSEYLTTIEKDNSFTNKQSCIESIYPGVSSLIISKIKNPFKIILPFKKANDGDATKSNIINSFSIKEKCDSKESYPKVVRKISNDIERFFSDIDNLNEDDIKQPVKKIFSCGPKNELIKVENKMYPSSISNAGNKDKKNKIQIESNLKLTKNNTPLLFESKNNVNKPKEALQIINKLNKTTN